MKTQHVATALTVANLVILICLMTRIQPVNADSPSPVLRGHKLEIVDDDGKVRASIQVVPAGPARNAQVLPVNDGKVYPESVLFRLIRSDGRPSVKIETSQQGSGLDLSGGCGPGYIVMSAKDADTSLTLTDKDGHRRVMKP
jgi:hypothetical protein